MADGKDVRPGNWSDVKDLYDNGTVSLIWGRYDGGTAFDVGIRWNGDGVEDPGYPKCFGNPVWFVLPPQFVLPVLHSLLEQVLTNSRLAYYRDEVYNALAYFSNRVKPNRVQKLIGLYGVANTGKTSTLKELIRLMIAQKWDKVFPETNEWEQDGCDAIVVLENADSGKRVVVSTGGDNDYAVEKGWQMCRKWRADIGVTASRKRDDSSSVQAIYAASRESGAQITWVRKEEPVPTLPDASKLWRQEAESLLGIIVGM